jgi:hypothetical protein
MFKQDKLIVRIIVLLILELIIFSLLAILSRNYLLPLLPPNYRTELTWLGGSIISALFLVAALAQFTGLNVKDLFLASKPSSGAKIEDIIADKGVVISVKDQGKVDWQGDILQSGSTKIVVDKSNLEEGHTTTNKSSLEKFIHEIQSNLYGDISRLPYVLTLSIDLCTQLKLDNNYIKWLLLELGGLDDFKKFKDEFSDNQPFEKWMEKWSAHRFVRTYIKFAYRSTETGRYEIDELKYKEFFIGFPVAKIVRDIQTAKRNETQEFSMELRQMGNDLLPELRKIIADTMPGTQISPEIRVYYNVSTLEKILDEIRKKIILMLNDAREIMKRHDK